MASISSKIAELVGASHEMRRIRELIEKASCSNCSVLIVGETGTGKELVARSIHFSGLRQKKPFVPVDCAALAPSLIESELFGFVKGAFTGAIRDTSGLFEAADGGTLFLDEAAELPLALQARLLRVLQEREVWRLGSTARVRIDTRVIVATNRDLEEATRHGSFRQDLYYRLNVMLIKVPPLRERKSDIPLLANFFLEKFADPRRVPPQLSEGAMPRLLTYDWPGNVRELENAIECAVVLGSGPTLQLGDLPVSIRVPSSELMPQEGELVPLEKLERRAIFHALRETNGEKLAAARLLGIGKTTLYRRLRQYASDRGSSKLSPTVIGVSGSQDS